MVPQKRQDSNFEKKKKNNILFGSWYACFPLRAGLFSSSSLFIHNTDTTCSGLIGHLQVYKLVLYCNPLQGNCYCRGFLGSAVQPWTF
jgi:hypothetical protein